MELFVVALYAHSASKLAIARINTLHRAQIHIPMPHCAQVHLITDTSTCKGYQCPITAHNWPRTPPVEGDSHIFFSYFDILYSFRSWRHIVRHFSNLNKKLWPWYEEVLVIFACWKQLRAEERNCQVIYTECTEGTYCIFKHIHCALHILVHYWISPREQSFT